VRQDKALSTLYEFMFENATAITKAVGLKEAPLTVDYRLHEIFEVLLDPAQEALVFQYVPRPPLRGLLSCVACTQPRPH
jgi:hypothetical protein